VRAYWDGIVRMTSLLFRALQTVITDTHITVQATTALLVLHHILLTVAALDCDCKAKNWFRIAFKNITCGK
jgi:hypothetical protein